MTKILLVEDEKNIRASLEKFLLREGLEVLCAENKAMAQSLISSDIHLVILDWMLPDGKGIDLLREWRAKNYTQPVIMLTARTELVDKVLGLELGADDYMTKPFEPAELMARINVQLRRRKEGQSSEKSENLITSKRIHIDLSSRAAKFDEKLIELTKMEFELLCLLVGNPNKVFSREEILNRVWGYERFPTTRTVDTHVLQLRQKFMTNMFETVRGVGYRFVMEEK